MTPRQLVERIRSAHVETRPTLARLGIAEQRSMLTALGALGAGILIGVGVTLLVSRLRAHDASTAYEHAPTREMLERRARQLNLEGNGDESQLIHVLRSR